ncbi:2Fe-2S iron-sulfur cluster-binding protein [Streptomyces sp. NPDC088745]|uniref:(2Fe-2S)-binding protein n=1 Tax=Streptomyces sp. NPDC088745 TaxID=3365884 RepID=UPI0037F79FA3
MTDNTEHTERAEHTEHAGYAERAGYAEQAEHAEQAGEPGNAGGPDHRTPHAPALGLVSHGWQPTPQSGEYDADATAFVQLPEGFDLGRTGTPLAAPGHDYVPPHITAPLETGTWNVHLHQDPPPYQDPLPYQGPQDRGTQSYGTPPHGVPGYEAHGAHGAQEAPGVQPHQAPAASGWPEAGHDAGATSQWNFTETLGPSSSPTAAGAAAPGRGSANDGIGSVTDGTDGVGTAAGAPTGQWAVPFTGEDSRDDSGEYPAFGAVPPTTEAEAETVAAAGAATAPHAPGEPGAPAGPSDHPAGPHAQAGPAPTAAPVPPATPWQMPGTPATLPGGAPAPWAIPPVQPAGTTEPSSSDGAHPGDGARVTDAAPLGDGAHPAQEAPFDGPQEPAFGTPAAGTPLPAPDAFAPDAEADAPGPAETPDAPATEPAPEAQDTATELGGAPGDGLPADELSVEGLPGDGLPGDGTPADVDPADGDPAPSASEPAAEAAAHDVEGAAAPEAALASEAALAPEGALAPEAAPAPNSADLPDLSDLPRSPAAPADDPEAAPAALHEAPSGDAPAAAPEPETGYGTEHAPDSGLVASPEAAFAPSYAAPHEPPPFHDAPSEHPSASYVLRVNGADRPVTDAWIGESLLYVLRERLGLAGAKDGCSQGECGACAVQVDGRLVASCLVPAATTAGSEVRTVEGLAADGEPSDVQRALANCGAVQCGFCIPGMAMTVHDLLEGNHAPTELETRQALCGNLCRCSGYRGVLEAVRDVVAEREAAAEAAATGHASDEARIPHQAPPGAGSAQHTLHHPHDGGMA